MPRVQKIQVRGGTAAEWAAANPVLALREPALETDTRKTKYGDGLTPYNSLPYEFAADPTVVTASRALVSNGSGAAAASNVTAAELAFVSGVTSAIQTQLDAKAASSHTHSVANVTSLQGFLDAKAALSHTHAIADSTGLQAALDAKAAASHTHTIADSTGLQAALDAKASQASVDAKLSKSGGTMTGALILAAAPTLALEPVTKGYLETIIDVGPTWHNAKSNAGGAGTQLAGDDSGDDAVKLENLLLYVAGLGGGKIGFPKGVYLFSRALQDTGASNTQCQIPLIDDHAIPVTIDLVGETTPPTQFYTVNLNPTGTGYSILKSNLAGATGTANMIGGKMHASSALWNNVMLNFEKLVIELPANPTLTGIDLSNQMGPRAEKVFIYDGTAREVHNEPTATNSYGIKLPPLDHSAYTYVESLVVLGLYHGVRLGERVEGSMAMYACRYGLEVPFAHHASHFKLGLYGCPTGIVAGGAHRIVTPLLNIQHDNGVGQPWQDAIADIDDSGNILYMKGWWSTVDASIGNTDNLIKNGGTNCILTRV